VKRDIQEQRRNSERPQHASEEERQVEKEKIYMPEETT